MSKLGNLANTLDKTLSMRKTPVKEVLLELIKPPEWQPRQKFEVEKLESLKESIRQHGLLQPIVVEPFEDGFRVVSGERRYRALLELGFEMIPVRILDHLTDSERIQVQIAENLQREDVTPIERARAVLKLFEHETGWSLDKILNNLRNYHQKHLNEQDTLTVGVIIEKIGKSDSTITRWLQLLTLPDEVQAMLDDPNGVFTPKHAGEVLKIDDIRSQIEIAKMIQGEGLSVDKAKEVIEKRFKNSLPAAKNIVKKFEKYTDNELELFVNTIKEILERRHKGL